MDLESIRVHGAASPSVHPSAAQRFLDHPVDRVAQLGREFCETLESVYPALDVDVSAQIEKIRRNHDLTPEARIRQANELKRQAADAAKDKARGAISYTLGRVEAAIEAATKEMERSLGEFQQFNLASEIREFIRSMPEDERRSFVLTEARTGNREVVAAALNSQRFLSGLDSMDDATFGGFRREALGLLDPERHQKVVELEGLRKAVTDALAGVDPGRNDLPGSPYLQ